MYLVRPPYLLKKLYPKALWRLDASKKKIYLTFDDGPVKGVTEWVLDILKEKKISATFFCVGENVKSNPEIFQRVLSEDHAVGNHTYNHLNGWNTHTARYIANAAKCAQLVSSKLFRPPYGKLKKSQLENLIAPKNKSFGKYAIILWDVLSGDYDKNTSPEMCLQNVKDYTRNGSIIVFHDSYKAEEKVKYALPKFIDWALKEEFEFCKLG